VVLVLNIGVYDVRDDTDLFKPKDIFCNRILLVRNILSLLFVNALLVTNAGVCYVLL